MKQTDYFERFDPPALNENMLRRELGRREERRRTVLLAIAGALLELAVALLAVLVRRWYPLLALACACFAVVSMAGSAAIAIVYVQKGGGDSEPCTCRVN